MNIFQDLRQGIDVIDEELKSLFYKRSLIVKQVKTFKDSTQTKKFQLYIRPDREYTILTQAVQSQGYSKAFFYNTWRGIISASNFLEQDIKLLSTCKETQYDIFHHFGCQHIPRVEQSRQKIINLLQSDDYHILGFKQDDVEILDLIKTHSELKIFSLTHSLADKKTLLCGKISLENFAEPAVFLTSCKTATSFHQEAKVFLSKERIEEKCIGAFYPLPL